MMNPFRLMVVLMMVWLMVPAPSASAQALGEFAGPFGLPIPSASLERYSRMLNLDRDQHQAARALYQGYRGSLRQAFKEGNEQFKLLESGDRVERANKGMELLDGFAARNEGIEREFFADLKVVLRPEQEPLLESVIRARRREVQMRFAFVAGEGVDLVAVLERLKASPAPGSELAVMMEEYEQAIDHLLVEKAKVLRASLQRAGKLMKNGMPDFELVSNILGDLHGIGGRIRDTNRKYMRMVDPLLTEEARTAMLTEVRMLTHPRVYAPTLATRMLQAAKELPDLTPKQVEELAALQAGYTRDLEAANHRYAAAVESTQERLPKEFMIVMQLREDPESQDPLVKARREREELNQRLYAKLRSLLSPEALQKLPQTETNSSRMPEFLPDFRLREEVEDIAGESGG